MSEENAPNIDNASQVDFSHRLAKKGSSGTEIDRLFNSIGFMTERAESILNLMLNYSNISVPESGLIDSIYCEVKDISSAVSALHHIVNQELISQEVRP